MKNLSILLCIVLCLSACKKSENNLPITPASLTGDWWPQTSTSTTYKNGVLSSTSTHTFTSGGNSLTNPELSLEFNDNLSGTYQQPDILGFPFTYTISGNHLSWTFSNDEFSQAEKGIPTSFTIKTLTNSKLELVYGTAYGDGTAFDDVYTR